MDEAHAKLKAELKSNRRAKRNERRRVNRIKAKTRNVSWNDLHEVLRQKAALESKKAKAKAKAKALAQQQTSS